MTSPLAGEVVHAVSVDGWGRPSKYKVECYLDLQAACGILPAT
jgi:hypothetical protein